MQLNIIFKLRIRYRIKILFSFLVFPVFGRRLRFVLSQSFLLFCSTCHTFSISTLSYTHILVFHYHFQGYRRFLPNSNFCLSANSVYHDSFLIKYTTTKKRKNRFIYFLLILQFNKIKIFNNNIMNLFIYNIYHKQSQSNQMFIA